jgi:hypothetical protein
MELIISSYSLPNLRQDSRHSLSLTMKELESLPPPPQENPAAKLLKLVTDFSADLKAHATSSRDREALIQACRRAFLEFRDDIFTTRPIFVPHRRDEAVDAQDFMKDEEELESGPPPAGPTKYLDHVRELIELRVLQFNTREFNYGFSPDVLELRSLTRELPHNDPYSVKVQLIEQCFHLWPVHSLICFDKVHASY